MPNSPETRSITPIDIDIGQRLHALRTLRAVSQERLAAMLSKKLSELLGRPVGFSFQQIQKYEKAKNRVSASILLLLAECLEVPVSYFYEQDGIPMQYPVTPIPQFTPQIMRLIQALQPLPTPAINSVIAFIEGCAKGGTANAE